MKKIQKGFTLIEILLVVVLLSVTVGVTSDILLSLVRSNTKTQVMNEIEQQVNFVSLKIEKELRDAKSAGVSEGTTLDFQIRDGTDIIYTLASGVLTRKVGDGTAQNLTSDINPGGVTVTCLGGSCFSISGVNPQVVNVNMEFRQAQSTAGASYSGSAKIETSIVIRNTY